MASEFPVISAWLNSKHATDEVASRHIIIQAADPEDDNTRDGDLIALACVGEEDYLASMPSPDIVSALDGLDDMLASEGGRLLAAQRDDDDAEEEADDADDDEED